MTTACKAKRGGYRYFGDAPGPKAALQNVGVPQTVIDELSDGAASDLANWLTDMGTMDAGTGQAAGSVPPARMGERFSELSGRRQGLTADEEARLVARTKAYAARRNRELARQDGR